MIQGNPMSLRSQLLIAALALLGLLVLILQLKKRRINEPLFFLWAIVFMGILIVGISPRLQMVLTRLVGAQSAISMMLLLALGFLFGASLVYSFVISKMRAEMNEFVYYVAELRLDIDELRENNGAQSCLSQFEEKKELHDQ
jgi:hypothetical protein